RIFAQRLRVYPDRIAIARSGARFAGSFPVALRGARLAGQRRGDRHSAAVDLPRHLPAPPAVPVVTSAGSVSELAAGDGRGLDGDARGGFTGGGAGLAADHERWIAISAPGFNPV